MIGWLGSITVEVDCGDPMECPNTDEFQECLNDITNFVDGLHAGGATWEGPLCTECGRSSTSQVKPCCGPR